MRRILALAVVAASASCGEGIHESADLGQPIATIKARIEGVAPDSIPTDNLRASMIWAAMPDEVEACMGLAEGMNQVFNCMAPGEIVPALATHSVPVEPIFPASFEVAVHTLPDTAIVGGSFDALFGYGILVVYDDGNGNQDLDLVGPDATTSVDTVVASGMPTEEETISFVVYREGGLSPVWKMFSVFGCPEPEQGFSITELSYAGAGTIDCVLSATADAVIAVHFEDSEEVRGLLCEPQADLSEYPSSEPPAGVEVICHSADSLEFVVDPSKYCTQTQYYELAGCDADFVCETPEWDLTASPPAWWPCSGTSSDGFTLTDDPAPLTTGSDDLFSISYDSGTETYTLDEIEVWVETGPSEVTSLTNPWFFEHADNDSNGVLSQGDVLKLVEPSGLDLLNEAHASTRTVELLRDTGPTSVEQIAEFTWTP